MGVISPPKNLEPVSADLKIRLVFSIPGKPRGRGRIERFFSTVNEMFLCELDGFAPAGGAVGGKPTLTLAAFENRFRTFLLLELALHHGIVPHGLPRFVKLGRHLSFGHVTDQRIRRWSLPVAGKPVEPFV
jgi:hypothetical protein